MTDAKTKAMKKLLFLVFILSSLFAGAQSSLTKGETVNALSFSGGVAITDSSTDWTPFIQKAVNYLTANRGGTIVLPAGNLNIAGTIYDTVTNYSANTMITIVGQGGPAQTYNNASAVGTHYGPTFLYKTTSTDTMFIVKGTATLNFENLTIGYSGASTTPTGIGVYYGNAYNMHMTHVGVFNNGINVDIKNGALWVIDGCWFADAHTYNLRIQDSLFNDYGDIRLLNTQFTFNSTRGDGATHIRYLSSGGLTMMGCKFNHFNTGHIALDCIDAPFIGTVDMNIVNNSFENFSRYAFHLYPTTPPGTGSIQFNGNQVARIGSGSYTGPIILFDATTTTIGFFSITNNVIAGDGIADTAIYIKGTHTANGTVNNLYEGFRAATNVVTSNQGVSNDLAISGSTMIQALSESANKIVFDPTLGSVGTVTITGNDTLSMPQTGFGQPFLLQVTQNGTGNFHLIVSSGNNTQGGSATVTLDPNPSRSTFIKGYTNNGGFIITDINRYYANSTAGDIPFNNGGLVVDDNFRYLSGVLSVGAPGTNSVGQVFITSDASDFVPGATVSKHVTSAIGPYFELLKSRGTNASPTTTAANDYLGQWWGAGHDGTGYKQSLSFGGYVDSTVSSNSVPAAFFVSTNYTSTQDPRGSNTRFNVDHLGRIGLQSGTLVGDTAHVTIGGDFSSFNNGVNGAFLSIRPAKYTSWNGSGTIAHVAANSIGKPQFASNVASSTYTNASTLYIDAAPVVGTNVTITNPYALYVNSGTTFLGGDINVGGAHYAGVSLVSATGTYNATATDYYIIFTGSTATLVYPTAVTGRELWLVNQASGTITIPTTTIGNASTSTSMLTNTNLHVVYDGTVWRKTN